ncbi:glycosyl transferase family 1 [Bacillus wiedmannii]|uniref:glycosyltransferase family 1 protein n=1 Tax=Bacillus TaxID=1386 RepID=UPI00077A31DA|nr:glycosyltransferase family 1 protein [Bacillus mobilis]KXY81398.1 glycosyl transferase family 1 [Bacillus wiedmannii]MED0997368.1 glycosyltransferase family 1 protein [Bacillus mobilis]PEW72051.1 glycosyltransferase family 1 protein [Bacillus cereus]
MFKQERPKRVLHIVSAMDRGGAETLLMNVYRNIDREIVQFDFVSHKSEESDYDKEIIALGGKIHRISSLGQLGPLSYIKELVKVMSDNQYVAAHAHTDYQGGIVAIAAKIAGIKIRICHSHSNNWPMGSGIKGKVLLSFLRTVITYVGTNYCACSVESARFLFQKNIDNSKVKIMKNAIDINQFVNVNIQDDNTVRDEFNIPVEKKVIGHIGRFSESKNHIFILKVFNEVLKYDPNFMLVLVGDGPLKNSIELESKRLGIYEKVRFLGVRKDIPRIIRMFDVFLFPSLFEGFGIVALEAQCAGVPCVVANTITKNVDMGLGIISFVSLDENLKIWSVEIQRVLEKEKLNTEIIADTISKLGFDIKSNIPEWLLLYGLEYRES